jgi:hypothetical protein
MFRSAFAALIAATKRSKTRSPLALMTAVLMMTGAGAAEATVISFDGLAYPGYCNPCGEAGYSFSANGFGDALFTWGPQPEPKSADPSTTSSALGLSYELLTATLTKDDGGSFFLNSIDFSDTLNIAYPVAFDMVFNFTGGGTSTVSYTLDSLVGLETFSFAAVALDSVSWTATSTTVLFDGLQWDNVNVAATPIPASLPLFISALAGFGFFGWRRRKCATATA